MRLPDHPERSVLRLQLRQNVVLKALDDEQLDELEPMLEVADCRKHATLVEQGVREMGQYFILEGILKRVVSNKAAREMILRFAGENDIETSYAAQRLGTPTPYAIVSVTRARVVRLPLPDWVAFVERHPPVKQAFEYEVMRTMSEIMAHTITLHLLDAPGRVHRFMRKHAELVDRLPQKELASYLNISPETLSRLKHQGKI
ncbi:MAG TPA: Crp/Fnr family transcriptional regulator [Caldimonas sp.]|nr:Crp/Fnr family transcriptional regulator [Caldimonas sp.]